jgi:chemotaxis protein methyltransferase CheR
MMVMSHTTPQSNDTKAMDMATFGKLRSLIYDKCGITLRDTKRTMLSARIRKRLRSLKLADFPEYLDYLLTNAPEKEWVQLINVVSTNVTAFFREPHHFEQLQTMVRQWAGEGQRRMRFWSAASSSGQEPYTMAITIRRALTAVGAHNVDAKILATDISTKMLSICKLGQYRADALEPIPTDERSRYFTLDRSTGMYQVSPNLRQMIHFARLNLSQPPYVMKGPLDVVFCRNVMIYFDNHVRGMIVEQVLRLLKPGGLLMVGHAESIQGMYLKHFHRIGASMYQRK